MLIVLCSETLVVLKVATFTKNLNAGRLQKLHNSAWQIHSNLTALKPRN